MVRNFPRDPEDFSDKKYTHDFSSKQDLIQKELNVIKEEALLLKKRITSVKESLKTLPPYDTQYKYLHSQIEKDQIELDELLRKKEKLLEELKK